MSDMSEEEYFSEEEYIDDDDDDTSDLAEDVVDDTALQEPTTKHQSFEVISEEQIMKESRSRIEGVMEFLGIPNKAIALVLLRSYNWNQEKLFEAYMEDSERVCQRAGVPTLNLEKPVEDPDAVSECLVCMEEYRNADSFALPCGHRYCRECWKNYLDVKIAEGPECITTKCMAPKCGSVVHEEAVKKIVDPKEFALYSKFLLRSFVDDNPKVRWCPAPNCTNCVQCERQNRREAVVCSCSFRFCFRCCDFEIGDHMPADCESVDAWLQKAADESENVTWMIANTKKCPQCRSPIEKNGGCMHMTCRKNAGGCGFEFCWLCRGPWSEHGSHTGGYYNCNKYDKSSAKDEDVQAENVKTELEHYMFYFHRFESHKNAMKIADEQRKGADKKGTALMEKFDVRAADTKFLLDATEQLINNRRVLQWSYVYGYYIDQDKSRSREKNLFVYVQEDLEKHTNYLSELYERPTEKIADYQSFIKWKEEVTNYTRVCEKFLKNFVEGVMGGLTTQDEAV